MIELEGIVRVSRYEPDSPGKQFLGATVESSDGTVWLITYEEQSPFLLFADCPVAARGEPYDPTGQRVSFRGATRTSHFRVSTMRLTAITPDTRYLEIGCEREL